MAAVDFDALRLIAGLRVERTDFSATGNAIEFDAGGDLVLPLPARSVSSEYTSVLPGLHLRHDRGDDWVFRGAWTQTISRPSFGDISPRMELNNEDQEVELGNPELDPYKSNNLDFSAERYLGRSGLLAAGLFYKKIDGYIVETVSNNVADFPGFEVTRPVNGDDATVYGVELNWQQTLDRLPGLWSGVLVGLSATFLDTEFELPARAGETFSLPRASDRILSAHLGYEKHGLSTRLSVVQRNEYLDSIGDDLDFDLYVQKHTQMDFNLDYRVNSTLGLFFEASNLLDEPLELYQGSAGNVLQYELYGRTYAAGFKLKL
jgi:TonB-dependent receptor